MTPSLSESRSPRRLSALLDESPWPADAGLRLVRSLARQIQTWHDGGRLHGAVAPDAVRIVEGSEPQVEPAAARPWFGGQYNDPDLCPPFLADEDVLELPESIADATALFKQRRLPLDPREIDLYQLGTLLCRLVTGKSVLVYMYDPRAKSSLPREVRTILERLVTPGPGESVDSCGQLAEAIDEALRSLAEKSSHDEAAHPGSETPARGSVLRAAADDTPAHGNRRAGPGVKNPGAGDGEDLPFGRLGIYTIVSRIGGGGMGDVYLARDESLDRPVALKVLPADLARDKEFVDRFRAEAAAAAKVAHPNVVPIYSIDEDAGYHFFSMHYVEGESLASLLNRRKRLPPDEAVALVRQCLAGLGAAHAVGLIHRDVKPANILIERASGRVMLVDFGLVRRLGQSARMTATGVIMGTVDYIAPEQARGKQVDGRTDLYSLGVMFYQLLSGRLPFEAETPTAMMFHHAYEEPPPLSELAPETPEALASIVARLMAKDPADRYQNAQSVLADLEQYTIRDEGPPEAAVLRETPREPPENARGAASAAPPLFHEPSDEALPEQLRMSPAPRARRFIRDWAATMFRRYSPQFVKELQGTTQQVDAAVGEYERRRERLARMENEVRGIVAELTRQVEENRRAAALADSKAAAAPDEAERREALAQRDACRQRVADMAGPLAEQEEQLQEITSQASRADATLAQLRSRRDLLKARWKAAEARARSPAARPASSRRGRWLAFMAAIGACLIGGVLLMLSLTPSQPRPLDGPIAPAGLLPQTSPLSKPDAASPKNVSDSAAAESDRPQPQTGGAVAKPAAVKPINGLCYNFRRGQSYMYEVRIAADLPTSKQTHSGQVTYNVKSVNGETGRTTLSATGSLSPSIQTKPGHSRYARYPGPPRPPLPFDTSPSDSYSYARSVTIDRQGQVVQYDSGGFLPFIFKPITLMVIDPMPAAGQTSWNIDRDLVLLKKEPAPFHRPPMFSNSPDTHLACRETLEYALEGKEGDVAVISKKCRLATESQSDGKPLLEQTGEGNIRFDTQAGVPASLDMKYTITVADEGITVEIPVTFTARLLSKAEAEEIRRKKEEAIAEAKARAAEAAKPKPIDDAEVDQLLADIASGDEKKVQDAVKRLAGTIPIENRRREVAKALEGVLEKRVHNAAINAVKALGSWGTQENAPAMAKALEPGSYGGKEFWLRKAALERIGDFPSPEAAAAVAGRLQDLSDREDAVKALKQMGPVAEEPVLKVLPEGSDVFTRAAACRVLADVGTAKSLEPLKKFLVTESNPMVAEQARKAVAAIEARQQEK